MIVLRERERERETILLHFDMIDHVPIKNCVTLKGIKFRGYLIS